MGRFLIIPVMSKFWYDIWADLNLSYPERFRDRLDAERLLAELGITIEKDIDGRWENIVLPDGDELILFMLKHL